jgi:hypothetical protein
VLIGIQVLKRLSMAAHEREIFFVLGFMIISLSLANVYRTLRYKMTVGSADYAGWLPPLAALIGAEVGFSSAGAGALGAVALMSMTTLTPALVVGTDMVFGLIVSTLGGGFHFFAGNYDRAIVIRITTGGVIGVFVGALLSTRISSRYLRLVLSICLIGLGLQLCWRAFK